MKRLLLIVALVGLALGIGLWLGCTVRRPTAYDVERMALSVEFARKLLPFKLAFFVLLGGVALLTLGGLGWGAVRWLDRRADTVYPDRSGLYPLREERIGRAKVFHDPNRTLTGTTVYTAGGRTVIVQHPLPEGMAGAQQQVTGQAQAAQALRAAVSGPSALPPSQRLPLDLLGVHRMSRPLPEVKELDYEPSHIERLLLEDGDSSA